MREFGRWIVEYPWTEVLEAEDVETKWRNYSTTTTEAFHFFFPVKDFSVNRSDAPWMTPRIKRLIKQRNRAYYTDRPLFSSLRNKVIKEISIAKSSYYPNKVEHLKQQNNSQCHLDKRNTSLALTFIDFKKAFDLVDHNIIISKAIQLGIQPHLYTKLIPAFSDENPTLFFREFEAVSNHFAIPQADWIWLIKPKLSPKRLQKYCKREFKEGDMVLAYIPICGQPLQAKYHGTYKDQKKMSEFYGALYASTLLELLCHSAV
ncbi:uncharacterized protein LOC143018753 [Oratosquilla oratoria]|uniref:uncharacterized protein LOC143018753 n=1 Tax=Oratosquilla oratoria TaxID=337810 RepID=UPI003F7767CC